MNPAWMEHAQCAGHPHPEDWFPETKHEQPANRRARHLCHQCPVTAECLAYAWQIKAGYGIWGGLRIDKEGGRT